MPVGTVCVGLATGPDSRAATTLRLGRQPRADAPDVGDHALDLLRRTLLP